MHNLKKFSAGVLALVMAFGLIACGNTEPATPPQDGQVVETTASSVGSIILCGSTRYALHYDGKGNITAIADKDGVACHSQLFGTSCADAVSQLLSNPDEPFTGTYLLIKQSANSLDPNKKFLDKIVAAAEKALENIPVLLCVAADQDDQGYFSAATAEKVLRAYLGSDSSSCTVDAEHIDGYYHGSATNDGQSLQYTIGALYGTVEVKTEHLDTDFLTYTEEELNPDYQPTDHDWEYENDSEFDEVAVQN